MAEYGRPIKASFCAALATIAVSVSLGVPLRADQIEGFTTPFRTVDVATAEVGIVASVAVREGDIVRPGQVLLKLDERVQTALLAAAKQSMQLHGKLAAASAEVKLRQERLRKLKELETRGSARPEEVVRARADLDIAKGRLLEIQEQLELRRLDCERARIQLERRTIRAPLAGVVARVFKEPGEFAGPNDPKLMTIVQLDPLVATFSAPSRIAHPLRAGHQVEVTLIGSRTKIRGVVDFVDPIVDGKSGTMRVKVRLDNPKGRFLSGEPCSLLISPDSIAGKNATAAGPTRVRP